jgi:hypothetical protein
MHVRASLAAAAAHSSVLCVVPARVCHIVCHNQHDVCMAWLEGVWTAEVDVDGSEEAGTTSAVTLRWCRGVHTQRVSVVSCMQRAQPWRTPPCTAGS